MTTLRNRCVRCDHIIEAPADRRGHEVVCPSCEATNVIQAPEDLARREDAERQRFLAGLTAVNAGAAAHSMNGAPRAAAHPGQEGWRTPVELHGHDRAALAARRLSDVSVYLLAAAYLLLLLSLGLGAGLALAADLPGAWSAFAFLACTFTGVLTFIVFKFMSDTVRALADLADLLRSVDSRLAGAELGVTAGPHPLLGGMPGGGPGPGAGAGDAGLPVAPSAEVAAGASAASR